jgi:hypothetical protein
MRRRSGIGKKTGVRKVNVPNLSGLTRSQAITAIQAAGLNYSESTTDTSDSGLTNYIQSQGTSSGDTVLIGTSLPFVYYNYVAPYYAPPYYAPYYAPPYYAPYYAPYYEPYYAPSVYHAPGPYHQVYHEPPAGPYYQPAPYYAPTNNCEGYYYEFGNPGCGGYAAIYNSCGQFLGCND